MNYFLFINFLCMFTYVFTGPIPIQSNQCSQVRNFILRTYIFTTKKKVKESLINKVYNFIYKTNSDINLLILDVNNKYSTLSEDDKFLLDQILNIIF